MVRSFRRSTLAFYISLVLIVLLGYINAETAILYNRSSGKNRALFGLLEFRQFGYKYWLLAPALLALVLAIADWFKTGGKKALLAALLSLAACVLVFVKLWVLWAVV